MNTSTTPSRLEQGLIVPSNCEAKARESSPWEAEVAPAEHEYHATKSVPDIPYLSETAAPAGPMRSGAPESASSADRNTRTWLVTWDDRKRMR